MFRLCTFGGVSIERDGVVLDQLSAQRKALAVLAVIAAAQSSGVSRDHLLALFWPDSDTTRARAALKQILHVLRKELGDVVRGTAQLRLDPGQIESDVGDFRQALADGDHDAAIRAYTGIFLEGVHVDDAAGFERWVDSEAAELARAHSDKLERLAHGAAARHDWHRAADLWRRLYLVDSLSTRVAIGLVHAVDCAGDRAGALKLAEEHDLRLKTELDLAPDAALAALVARLRAAEASGAEARAGAGAGARTGAGNSRATAPQTAGSSVPGPLERAPIATQPHRRRARYVIGMAAVLALLIVLVLVLSG
jgi:DNA-binding SARP family transcriptional activator